MNMTEVSIIPNLSSEETTLKQMIEGELYGYFIGKVGNGPDDSIYLFTRSCTLLLLSEPYDTWSSSPSIKVTIRRWIHHIKIEEED